MNRVKRFIKIHWYFLIWQESDRDCTGGYFYYVWYDFYGGMIEPFWRKEKVTGY